MDIDLILRKHTKLENFEYYAEVHESKFYVGQAYYLCSKLLGAPLTTDMKELAQHSQSVKLAELCFKYDI
ncbi:hypothetical protein M3231_09735 [Neobacillus mesonae]|nr:hypothetical protein [Neobacillus mesonae]